MKNNELLSNIDKLHTTILGSNRIKKNLQLNDCDVVMYCKNKILDRNCNIYKRGKNWYCKIDNIKITINSNSYTIITAHQKDIIMKDKLLCKIPSEEEMNIKWDYEIEHANNKDNFIMWKKENLKRFKDKSIIPYYGILNGNIICEATAMIDSKVVQNSAGLVGNKKAYLSAFRTISKYQNKGYFGILFRYMLNDLKQRGYTKVTLGVEPSEIENKEIYRHFGFDKYIKSALETYPDGTVIDVDYYEKNI